MIDTLKNIVAVVRGNIIFGANFILGRCKYKNIVRLFKRSEIRVCRGGKLSVGKGVSIRENCLITVRKGAKVKLGNKSSFNRDCKLVCHECIEIGDNTIFGPNVIIYDHDHIYEAETGVKRKEYKSSEVIIGKNCWIGANTVILRGTHIGDNCVVGAGSVVKGDYPAGTKIIQKRNFL